MAIIMLFTLVACNSAETSKPVEEQKTPQQQEEESAVSSTPVDEDASIRGGHLNFAVYSKPQSLDPSYSTGIWRFMFNTMVYESALTRDVDGNICPNVCEFELSDDQLTLKLWVREGMTFHDGSEVEIEDVVASITRNCNKHSKDYIVPFIKSVDVADGVATFTFTEYEEKTLGYIANVQSYLAIIPKEICEKYSAESELVITDLADAIGTGPYKFTDLVPEVSISVERYDGYKPVAEGYSGAAGPKKAYLDSATYYYASDENATALALLSGQYDLFENIPVDYVSQAESAGVLLEKRAFTAGAALTFNTFGNGATAKNVNLRRAILACVDIPEFIDQIQAGGYTIGCCPVLDEAYYTDAFTTVDWFGEDNIELAKKYLKEANYNGETVKLAIDSNDIKVATMIGAYLDAAGISYEVVSKEETAYKEFIGDPNNDWDFYFWYPTLANTPTMLDNNLLYTNYNSAEKDALIEELRGMVVGSEEYVAKWNELANMMVDDCATAYLATSNLLWFKNQDLNLNYEGKTPYFYNTYWTNPEDHGA